MNVALHLVKVVGSKIAQVRYERRPDVVAWKADVRRVEEERSRLLREHVQRIEATPDLAKSIERWANIHRYISKFSVLIIFAGVLIACFWRVWAAVILTMLPVCLARYAKETAKSRFLEGLYLPEFPPGPPS